METTAQPFGAYLKSYFKNLWQTIKHPLAFLPTIIITGVWIFLGILQSREGEEPWLAWVNFFTFAQGGLFGGVAGAIGGILGKILIATLLNALLLPIFIRNTRPMARFGKGFKGFFRSFAFDSLRAISTFLTGAAIALAIYSFLNITQRWQEGLVGVAGAVLLIRSIGQKGGLLFSLFYSILSGLSRNKIPSQIGITRFLSGMSLGFVVGTGLNAFGLKWAIFIALCCIAGAFLFVFFGKRKRAALVTASVVALLLVPVHAQDMDQINEAMRQLRQAGASDGFGLGGIDLTSGHAQDDISKIQEEYQRRMEDINRRIEDAERRGDDRELERLSQELGQLNMSMALGSMDLYKQSQGLGGIGFGGSSSGDDDYEDHHHDGSDGHSHGSHDDDDEEDDDDDDDSHHGKYGDGSGFEDFGSMFDQAYEDVKEVATEGLADEDTYVDDEEDITWTDGIAGATAAAGAAGAAAGGAAGGAGGPGGTPDLPDFPDGEEPEEFDYEGEEEKKEEDEEYDDSEEEDTEGGDGDGDDSEDEENKEEPEETEEEDDYDYEAEREQREREQAEINKRYADEHQKDWETFSTTSSEERINKEAEEWQKEEEARQYYLDMLEDEEQRQDKIINQIAPRLGVPTVDENGNPREIWDIQHDCEKAVLANRNKGLYQDMIDIHQISNEVELECSEKIAELELTDKVAEGTVNIMGEYVPGGKYVKDAHGFIKAVGVSGMEAHAEGRSVTTGLIAGTAKGTLTVLQNHSSDLADAGGLEGVVKFGYTGTVNVLAEADKEIIDGLAKGKSADEIFENAQNAMVKKTGEHLINSGLGALGMSDKGSNITTEFIMRGHDEVKFGEGDDAKTLSETITGKINDAKNDTLGTIMYKTGLY